ncbi:MAG: hypothetical protein EHM41_17300 [Chloroflexi bacterium]|nr:MAG: hypothetical protein EHM41_17300 [Chloroflexota bacterium]
MESIGDFMLEGRAKAFKTLAIVAGIVVYGGMLVYSGVHNYNLMTAGVPADLLIWSTVGVVALEISAAALPLALHFWCHSPIQRYTAFAFYGIDLAIIFLNVILDFGTTAGSALPAWSSAWLFYGVPATPIISGFGWTMLFMLDPSSRQREIIEQLKASTFETLSQRIVVAAKDANINAIVEDAARQMAFDIVSKSMTTSKHDKPKLENPTLPPGQ